MPGTGSEDVEILWHVQLCTPQLDHLAHLSQLQSATYCPSPWLPSMRKVDEDGDSSEEEEPQPQTVSAGGGSHATNSSLVSPTLLVGAEPGCHSTTPDGEQDSENQQTADGTTVTRASEGTGRQEAGHRARLRPGGACRVAKLWSKLRAVAYITSLQVGKDEE